MSQYHQTRSTPMPWTSDELQQATQGQWSGVSQPLTITRIVTDNRQVQQGDAFLALKGERFDAHDFAKSAAEQGASVIIVARQLDDINIPQLIVADTRLALGDLGAYRRQQYPHLKVVALTGSSGKTTVKEMLGSILHQIAPTLITRGNLNNDLGVPMMLLELKGSHQFAVMELGANHVGEIDYTSNMVKPQVAGVLNIGTAHMGEFGGRIGIAKAKSEIFAHLPQDGIAVVPASGDFSEEVQQAASEFQQIQFGLNGDVTADNIQLHADRSEFDLLTPQGNIHIQLPFAGAHNVDNALAAASFALALNVDLTLIASGLSQAESAKGRLNFKQVGNYLIIDDTYNANPHSMRAAAKVLEQQQGTKVLVIGDIGELGEDAASEHFLLGQDLANMSLDAVFTVGEFAQHTFDGAVSQSDSLVDFYSFTEKQDLLEELQAMLANDPEQAVSLLFKGSRYTKMESLIVDLVEKA
jgi:UDP-N-acetylmuramoyl-tripeptide--D-alanyl-D-alanine ligase